MIEKVHVSRGSGKLAGIRSINTNPLTNEFCRAASLCPPDLLPDKKKLICRQCYSIKMLKTFRKNCVPAFQRNSNLLRRAFLELRQFPPPFKPGEHVRFNSHGELINAHHLSNLYDICKFNPEVKFSLFTKRAELIRAHITPDNLTLIYSNPIIDSP